MTERPVWRQAFDSIEQAVAPRLEEAMTSDQVHVAIGLATQAQRAVQRQVERATRRTLHLMNLPAGSDVTRLLNELGKLQREVRDLGRQLEEERRGKDGSHGRGTGGNGSPGARSTGS